MENYDDELYDDVVLQTILAEVKTMDVFKDIVNALLELRPRELIKAKVKYLLDPEYQAKFEQELSKVRESLLASEEIKDGGEPIPEDKILQIWRDYEKANIAKEQSTADYARKYPDLAK